MNISDEVVEAALVAGAVHRMEWAAVADGTRDEAVCSVCGVVRGGFVVAGAWPCPEAGLDPRPSGPYPQNPYRDNNL